MLMQEEARNIVDALPDDKHVGSDRLRASAEDSEENEDDSDDVETAEEIKSEDDLPQRIPWWERYRLLKNVTIVFFYFLVGVIFVRATEGWGTVESLYVIVQIITTIGYGDCTVTQPASEWFMIFYVLVGLMVCANIINDNIDRHINMASEAMRSRLRQLEAYISSEMNNDEVVKKRCGHVNRAVVALLIYIAFIIAGTLFFGTYERCSCSYGDTRVAGCVDGDQCFVTGGYQKNFRSALYLSVITLSTTGFGDYSPKSEAGRLFSIIWMPFGVLAWVNLITAIMLWWRRQRQAWKIKRLRIDLDELNDLDMNHDGRVTRAEFRIFLLMRENIIKKADVEHLDSFFDSLDQDKSGWLSHEELMRAAKLHRKILYNYKD